MMGKRSLCVGILLLVALCVCSAHIVPRDWTLKTRARGANEVQHKVAFVVRNNDGSHQKGHELLYGNDSPAVLSLGEIEQLFINKTAVKIVEDFLRSNNLPFETKGNWVWVTASTSVLDELLSAEFHLYVHKYAGKIAPMTNDYVIPSEISYEVSNVLCAQSLPAVRRSPSKGEFLKRTLPDPPYFNDLRTYYGVPATKVNNTKISQGVLGASNTYLKSDLAAFFAYNNIPGNVSDVVVYNTTYYDPNLCIIDYDRCGETNMDVQAIMGMAPGVKTWVYFTTNDGLTESANWLATYPNAPQSFSSSYAYPFGKADAIAICNQVQIAALRGITYFTASGDVGYSDPRDFPNVCPYVVSVGGTMRDSSPGYEVVWMQDGYNSGTEAAADFAAQSYQLPFQRYYLKQVGNFVDFPSFNRSARLFADVACYAKNLLGYFYNGDMGGGGGTSNSSPLFAGIYSRVNAYRNSTGQALIKNLNKALAILSAAGKNPLNDITVGYAYTETNWTINLPAIQGWDMPTGFGTPNYTKMIQYLGTFNGTSTTPLPQTQNNITITVNAGAGAYYLQLYVQNDHGLTTGVEVRSAGSTTWLAGAPQSSLAGLYNWYPAPSSFTLPISVRLTASATTQQITLGDFITSYAQQTLKTSADYVGVHYYTL